MPITDFFGLNLLKNSQIKALATGAFLFGGIIFSIVVFAFWEMGQKSKEAIQIIKAPETGNILGSTAPEGFGNLSNWTNSTSTKGGLPSGQNFTNLINLNTATLAELVSLPEIGEGLAQKIIDYRNTNGPFTDTRQVMRVSGIKEAKFSKFKDFVTVQ